jgi:hypothetical protein
MEDLVDTEVLVDMEVLEVQYIWMKAMVCRVVLLEVWASMRMCSHMAGPLREAIRRRLVVPGLRSRA